MLRVKRFSKVTDKVKEIGKSIEHTVTHPKETGKKVVEYVKKHPDEAIVLGTSDIVPGVVAAKLAKAGKTKQAAIAGTIACSTSYWWCICIRENSYSKME